MDLEALDVEDQRLASQRMIEVESCRVTLHLVRAQAPGAAVVVLGHQHRPRRDPTPNGLDCWNCQNC